MTLNNERGQVPSTVLRAQKIKQLKIYVLLTSVHLALPKLAITLAKCITLAKESSLQKWNTSPCANPWV